MVEVRLSSLPLLKDELRVGALPLDDNELRAVGEGPRSGLTLKTSMSKRSASSGEIKVAFSNTADLESSESVASEFQSYEGASVRSNVCFSRYGISMLDRTS